MKSPPTLFGDVLRSDHRSCSRRTSAFEFLNLSAWPAAENARSQLETWFAVFPESAKKGLRARFRSSNHNHESAFFELFLHQVFLRLGLAPEVDPQVPELSSRPDFLIRNRNGCYYVEAAVAEQTGDFGVDPLENEILDAVDGLAVDLQTRIAVAASTTGKLHRSVSKNEIQREVRAWLEGIDISSIRSEVRGNPELPIKRGDWTLTLTAVGLLNRPSDRLIQVGPTRSGRLNDAEVLQKKIHKKANQHSKLDRPLIVAINTQSGFEDREEERSALIDQQPESVWRTLAGTRHTGLHGVLFFRTVVPWNLHCVSSNLYLNPFIDPDVPDELLRLGKAHVCDGKMKWETGEPLGDLLGLPDDWPGERTSSADRTDVGPD